MSPVSAEGVSGPAQRSPASATPVLELSNFCVDYGEGQNATHAVVDVDLTLHRGEVIGLAGESGSGKSTLAYAATRLLRPPGIITGGNTYFYPEASQPMRRVNLTEANSEELRRLRWAEVAIVFQSAMHALNPVLAVETQLTDTLIAHGAGRNAAERHERCVELFEMVGIHPDRLRSFPHELSGGMRQRVMIAMALALRPQVVIMDEPTTALDVVTQREILQQVIELRDKLSFSVLFITHDLSLLVELADTIAVMYAGRLVELAPARDLFHAPRHPYSLGLLNSFPSLHGEVRPLSGIPGSPPDLRDVPQGCAFHPRCQYSFDRCSTDPPSLVPLAQDYFRSVACWLHDGDRATPAELSRKLVATPATAGTGVVPATSPAANGSIREAHGPETDQRHAKELHFD